jgi:hypothetical protein
MAVSKPKRLVKALLTKTQKGDIDWQEAFSNDTFQVSFKDHTVQISMREGLTEGSPIYFVNIINEGGIVADRFDDEDLDQEDGGKMGGPWFKAMKDLYNLALRHARGADKALNAILNEIEDDDIPF